VFNHPFALIFLTEACGQVILKMAVLSSLLRDIYDVLICNEIKFFCIRTSV